MRLEHRQIREILDSAFEPLNCECEVLPDGSLTLKIFDSQSGRVEMIVAGISTSKFYSIRQISELIAELRTEINVVKTNSINL